MSQTSLLSTVTIVDGTPRVSSLAIAEHFGKRHERVLDSIRRIINDLQPVFCKHNFVSTFVDIPGPNGGVRKSPAYSLTRDAFSLVAMGFTGKAALAWKVRYIEAFNAMEAKLMKQAEQKSRKALPYKMSPIDELRAQIDALRRSARAEKDRIVMDLMSYLTDGDMGSTGFQRYDVIRGPVYMMLEEIIGTGTDASFKYNNPCDLVIRMKALLEVQPSR